MAELESIVNGIETKISNIETKVDMFIGEIRDFKNEMRKQNEMRAAEIARVDAKIEKLREQREKDNAKHAADIKLSMKKSKRNLTSCPINFILRQ